jgi:hypothetical protein
MEADAEAGGAVEQKLVQDGAADASTGTAGEHGFGGGVAVGIVWVWWCGVADEADAAEESVVGVVKIVVIVEAEGG